MKKVLIADDLPVHSVEMLRRAGLAVECRPGLAEEALAAAAAGVHGIICRSAAQISEAVLAAAPDLEAVCRAGVGVDNIDVAAASRRGVVVMNTPGANTISTAEHAFALMLGLARNIGPAYLSMRDARWDRGRFMGAQLAGSVLGIIGLGRVGQEVARRAAASGMKVHAFDPQVSREKAESLGVELVETLEGLLSGSDYVTVHVPESDVTRGLIGAEQVAVMRDGARIINCARGSVVDQDAVVAAVKSGKLAGAAFDVYETEPPDDYEFARDDRILATPHLGASTEQAQLAVATAAAEQLIDVLLHGRVRNAVNAQLASADEMVVLQPYCDLAEQLGKLVAQLSTGQPEALEVSCTGGVADLNIDPIVHYGAVGMLASSFGGRVNIVSAPHLADERGIRITSTRTSGATAGFTDVIEVGVRTDEGEVRAAGTLLGREHPRVIRMAGFDMELVPEGHILVVFNNDMPGAVGWVGAALGEAGINIARMGVARQDVGGNALLAFNLDTPCDQALMDRIASHELIQRVVSVKL